MQKASQRSNHSCSKGTLARRVTNFLMKNFKPRIDTDETRIFNQQLGRLNPVLSVLIRVNPWLKTFKARRQVCDGQECLYLPHFFLSENLVLSLAMLGKT
jgi:hypothetical protein